MFYVIRQVFKVNTSENVLLLKALQFWYVAYSMTILQQKQTFFILHFVILYIQKIFSIAVDEL